MPICEVHGPPLSRCPLVPPYLFYSNVLLVLLGPSIPLLCPLRREPPTFKNHLRFSAEANLVTLQIHLQAVLEAWFCSQTQPRQPEYLVFINAFLMKDPANLNMSVSLGPPSLCLSRA
jgi:hypothetical protein